jgi:Lysine methyltransferase
MQKTVRGAAQGNDKDQNAAKDIRLVFPDALERCVPSTCTLGEGENGDNEQEEEDEDEDIRISQVFFDLANAGEVSYRIRNTSTGRTDSSGTDGGFLVFHQDMSACHNHTGGIIWETSYLLLEYMLHRYFSNKSKERRLGRLLELGCGVGFLGQCLAAEALQYTNLGDPDVGPTRVVLTETAEVLTNVQANVTANKLIERLRTKHQVDVCALDWTRYERDVAESNGKLAAGAFDTLLGTDVVFAPFLVEPLLQTAAFMSHPRTVWYLCIQIRCAASHQMLLEKAPTFGFVITDITQEALALEQCSWGKAIDCLLYRITRSPEA